MKIGIIADTHIGKNLNKLNNFLEQHLNNIDMIIHAGDYKTAAAVNTLKDFRRFLGVWGNVDVEEVRGLVAEKEIIEVANYRIGVFHGHGTKKTTIDRAYDAFEKDDVDIIVFGHSHQPIIKTKGNVLMLNPGSPTSKRRERWFSYIILELETDTINASLRFFTKKD
ncbi:metallophosphoesterase family protein [Wukongibacter baidiensis]|uniref:metallophosphoesterase family protein n=1 Tax=Wukongibacter baidiensis TaxID=1723361 RepID=UPI003D7FD2E8